MLRYLICTSLVTASCAIATAQHSESPAFERKVVRIAEPDYYFVEASKLRVRDDPFAGNVVRSLEWGKKISVYDQIDNWMRITPQNKPAQWVNGDFVSTERVTWSAYSTDASRYSNQAVSDVNLTRVKYDGDKKARIFAFNRLALSPEKRMVDTRHNLETGPYYKRYLVQCAGKGKASHTRLLGEGYSFMNMFEDQRNTLRQEPLTAEDAVSSDITKSRLAIAEFACGKRG